MTRGKQVIVAAGIGLIAGILCYDILKATKANGDLWLSLTAARDLVAGNDPYRNPRGPDDVPYPLTAALIAMPLSFFADPIPSALFMGLSSGLLAWLILISSKPWKLLLLLSWPFAYALLFVQWTPLMACMWFLPVLMPLVLVKPQIALPMILTAKPDWRGVLITILIGVLSLLIYPAWPWIWLRQTAGYQGTLPPLFVLPLGPLVALALLRWRKRTAWLLFLMALMPQRVVYDQLCLMLVASNWRELLLLISLSWITMPALLHFGGWPALPGGWQIWIVATLYIPALFVVLRTRKEDEPA
jgi:hypothetical protein